MLTSFVCLRKIELEHSCYDYLRIYDSVVAGVSSKTKWEAEFCDDDIKPGRVRLL